jgi:hypothetical protein
MQQDITWTPTAEDPREALVLGRHLKGAALLFIGPLFGMIYIDPPMVRFMGWFMIGLPHDIGLECFG